MMKRIEVFKESGFSDKGMQKFLIHDSPYFRVINFLNSHHLLPALPSYPSPM